MQRPAGVEQIERNTRTVPIGPVTIQVNGAQEPDAVASEVRKQLALVAEMG